MPFCHGFKFSRPAFTLTEVCLSASGNPAFSGLLSPSLWSVYLPVEKNLALLEQWEEERCKPHRLPCLFSTSGGISPASYWGIDANALKSSSLFSNQIRIVFMRILFLFSLFYICLLLFLLERHMFRFVDLLNLELKKKSHPDIVSAVSSRGEEEIHPVSLRSAVSIC